MKARRMTPGYAPLEKPAELVNFERANKLSAPALQPAVKPPAAASTGQPSVLPLPAAAASSAPSTAAAAAPKASPATVPTPKTPAPKASPAKAAAASGGLAAFGSVSLGRP